MSSEVQAIGDRIFFTDIQWCKNFSSIIPYKTYFFSEQEVFSLGISLQDFFLSKSVWNPGRVRNPRKFCLPEYGIQQSFALKGGILGFGTRNTAQGIWNSPTIGIQNQSSTIKESEMQYMESGNHGVESRNQDCCP